MNAAMRDISVLLIEDNRDDEWIALRTLKKIGIIDITVARDGFEALLMLHGDERKDIREICSPEIILLDLRLPKIDGLEVLRRIRGDDRTKTSKVLVLTSSEDPYDKAICRDLGVTAFLPKPLKEEALIDLNLTSMQLSFMMALSCSSDDEIHIKTTTAVTCNFDFDSKLSK